MAKKIMVPNLNKKNLNKLKMNRFKEKVKNRMIN